MPDSSAAQQYRVALRQYVETLLAGIKLRDEVETLRLALPYGTPQRIISELSEELGMEPEALESCLKIASGEA